MKNKVNYRLYSKELLAYFIKCDNDTFIVVNSDLPLHEQREALTRIKAHINNSNDTVGLLKKGYVFFGSEKLDLSSEAIK